MPHVGEMLRELTWNDVDDFDPDLLRVALELRKKELGRGSDPAQAMAIKGLLGGGTGCPCFHFDEGQYLAAASNEVDFADRGAEALGEHGPAFAAQIPSRYRLGAAAAALRFGARLAQRLSSSARS